MDASRSRWEEGWPAALSPERALRQAMRPASSPLRRGMHLLFLIHRLLTNMQHPVFVKVTKVKNKQTKPACFLPRASPLCQALPPNPAPHEWERAGVSCGFSRCRPLVPVRWLHPKPRRMPALPPGSQHRRERGGPQLQGPKDADGALGHPWWPQPLHGEGRAGGK